MIMISLTSMPYSGRSAVQLGLGMVMLALLACGSATPTTETEPDGHDHGAGAPSNRTPIPPIVRRNLGITFAKATYRPVAATVTLPGRFELQAGAEHHYQAPVAGRLAMHVTLLQSVRAGDLLFTIDAPLWRETQHALLDLGLQRDRARLALAQAKAAREAAGSLSPGLDEETVHVFRVRAAEAELGDVDAKEQQLVRKAATLTGLSEAVLMREDGGQPYWQTMSGLPVHAVGDGVVRDLAGVSGTWIAEGDDILHVVAPRSLQFRAKALQADLIDKLRDGQQASIVPPDGATEARRGGGIAGTVKIGVTGDPDSRTVDVFVRLAADELPAWPRPQVAALVEVAFKGDPDEEELAIPVRAVIQDGLETVFFRRDPKDPDQVIRTVADLGPSDGRWVTVWSGLAENDEVVVDGVYQLKLATTGQEVKAGHFHADGTWHEGDH